MEIISQEVRKQIGEQKWSKGVQFYKKSQVQILEINQGYTDMHDEVVFEINTRVISPMEPDMTVQLWATEGDLIKTYCECKGFQEKAYYGYYSYYGVTFCMHVVAAIMEVLKYQTEHTVTMRSNRMVAQMLGQYIDADVAKAIVNQIEEKIEIEPKIEYDDDFHLNFRIGGAKKYVIKDLYEFARRMRNNEEYSYGKDLTVLHNMDSFTEESQKMVMFILNIIRENELVMSQLSSGYQRFAFDKRSLNLSPAVMESFFPLVKDHPVLFHDKSFETATKKPVEIRCKEGFEKVKVCVTPYTDVDVLHDKGRANRYERTVTKEQFQGIKVVVEAQKYIIGQNHLYSLQNNTLYQTDSTYRAIMLPLFRTLELEGWQIVIGEGDIGTFYSNVLKKMENYIELEEQGKEQIEEYLPKEDSYIFYLERDEDSKVTCCLKVRYGDVELVALQSEQVTGCVRNLAKELEISFLVRRYFDEFDEKTMTYGTQNESNIYQLLLHGIAEFNEVGEVQATDAFRRLKIHESPKVRVGVSVESNLMNLEITSNEFDFTELNEILGSYRLRKKYHRMKNGEFLQLEENSLETLVELVEGMHLTSKELLKGKMHIPAYRALYLDRVLAESEGVNFTRDSHFKSMIRSWKSVEDSDYEVPQALKSVLRGYQKTGYRWLRTIDEYGFGGILADDMGLGKTLQIISVLSAQKAEGKEGTSIIICPASLVYNWESEFRHFAPELKVVAVAGTVGERESIIQEYQTYDVLITSYDLLKRDIEQYEDKSFLYEVIDEAQYIKNHTTQGAKAVKILKAKTRYALTGTPIENRLSELWSIFDYLMPGYLYKYDQFKKELEQPVAKNQDEKLMERLKKMVQPFILRRLKSSVLKDLPEKLEQVTYSRFEGEQQKLYDAYVSRMKQQLSAQSSEEFAKNKLKILADLTRLRQICCDPHLCYENYTGNSAKLDTCMDLVENAIEAGHKVLLFSQFTSMLAVIGEKLKEKQISYYEITGDTAKQKRVELVNQFNSDDTNVFLISLKAGGTGLNLTGADIVIHYDPWWNVAAQNQATDRAHRIGQKNVVTVFKLITQNTIEEKILKLQESKQNLADQIISGEMNQLSNMTKEDFMELL